MMGELGCSSNEPNREPREIRGRARRCNRGRTPLDVTGRFGREDAVVERSGSQKTCLGNRIACGVEDGGEPFGWG
jgi:hypothetical protein